MFCPTGYSRSFPYIDTDLYSSTLAYGLQEIVVDHPSQDYSVNTNHSYGAGAGAAAADSNCVSKLGTVFSTEGHVFVIEPQFRPYLSRPSPLPSPSPSRSNVPKEYVSDYCPARYQRI